MIDKFIYFLIILIQINQVFGQPKCIGPGGQSLEYWFLFRVKELDSYVYYDKDVFQGRNKLLEKATSPVYQTLNQAKANNYGVIAYTDQPPDRSTKSDGHTKGFVIFDQNSGKGLHVIHSLPEFPKIKLKPGQTASTKFNPTEYEIDLSSDDWLRKPGESQHFQCYTFTDPSIASTYITRVDASLLVLDFDSSITANPPATGEEITYPPGIKINFNDFLRNPIQKRDEVRATCRKVADIGECVKKFTITSGIGIPGTSTYFLKTKTVLSGKPTVNTGRFVFNTRNAKTYGIDIWHFVPEHYNNQPFFVATQQKDPITTLSNSNHLLSNAYNLNIIDLLGMNRNGGQQQDIRVFYKTPRAKKEHERDLNDIVNNKNHAKLAFTVFPNPNQGLPRGNQADPNIFCVGDSNRHGGQQNRGGGVLCYGNTILSMNWNRAISMYSHVTSSVQNAGKFQWSVYTKNQMTLVDDNNVGVKDATIEMLDVVRPSTQPQQTVFRTPERLYKTDASGSLTFFMNSLRSKVKDGEDPNFKTFNVSAASLYSPYVHFLDSQFRFCAGSPTATCEHNVNIIRGGLTLQNPDNQVHYPTNSPSPNHVYNVLNTGVRVYKYGDSSKYLLQCKGWGIEYLKKFKELVLNPTLVFNQFFIKIRSPNTLFVSPNTVYPKPVIQLKWDSFTTTEFDLDAFYYVFTENVLYSYTNNVEFKNTGDWGVGLILAVSKYISLQVNPARTTTFSDQFRTEHFPSIAMPIGFDIENTDKTINTENALRFASAFYDLLDANDDRTFGHDNFGDINIFHRIGLKQLIDEAVKYKDAMEFNMFKMVRDIATANTYTQQFITINTNILNYNFITTGKPDTLDSPMLMLSTTTTTNDLRQILINNGNFSQSVINSLTEVQLQLIQQSLDKWVILGEIFSEGINVLLKDSTIPTTSIQMIKYLDDISENQLKSLQFNYSPQLCLVTLSLFNYRFSICDPMSIPLLTEVITDLILSSDNAAETYRIGDISLYFSPVSPNYKAPGFVGVVVATLNSKICDIKYVAAKSEFTDRSIVNQICLKGGPIISSISGDLINSTSQGGNTITLNGSRFLSSDQVQIGNKLCSTTNIISSTQISCIVPTGTGFNQPITIRDRLSHQITKFNFNYQKSTIIGISVIKSKGDHLSIVGTNFGNSVQDVLITIGTKESTLECQILTVVHDRIECKTPVSDIGEIRLLRVKIRNQNFISKVDVLYDYSTVLANTQYIVNPGEPSISINSSYIPTSRSSVLVGDLYCKFERSNETHYHCSISQLVGSNNRLSIQDGDLARSTVKTPAIVNYQPSRITALRNSNSIPTATGYYIQILGGSLKTIEDLSYFKLGNTDYSSNCKVFNEILECRVPRGIGSRIPIGISINEGSELLDPVTGQKPTISYSKPVITSVQFINNYVEVKGTNFVPKYVSPGDNSYLKYTYKNGDIYDCMEILFINENEIRCFDNNIYTYSLHDSYKLTIGGQDSDPFIPYLIRGYVFNDKNNDNIYNPFNALYDIKVSLLNGDTGTEISSVNTTFNDGWYYFLPPLDTGVNRFRVVIEKNTTVNLYSEEEFKIDFTSGRRIFTNNFALQKLNIYGCVGYIKDISSENRKTNFQYGTYNINNYGYGNCQGCIDSFETKFPDHCLVSYQNQTGQMTISYRDQQQTTLTLFVDETISGVKGPTTPPPPVGLFTVYLSLFNNNNQLISRQSLPISTDGVVQVILPKLRYQFSIEKTNPNSDLTPAVVFSTEKINSAPISPVPPFIIPLFTNSSTSTYQLVKFYDGPVQRGDLLQLPVGKYNLQFLERLGWANRVRSFNCPTNLSVYISITDSIQTVITNIPHTGLYTFLDVSVGQQLEISIPNFIPNTIKNYGVFLLLPLVYRGDQPKIYQSNGEELKCFVEQSNYKCWVHSQFGRTVFSLFYRELPIYQTYETEFVPEYPIGTPPNVQGDYLTGPQEINSASTSKTLKYAEGGVTLSEFTFNPVDGSFVGKVGTTIVWELKKSEIGANWVGPFRFILQTDGNICVYGTSGGSGAAYCLWSHQLSIKYLQMTRNGIILQRANGDIVWSRTIYPDYYKTQSVHPLIFCNLYLDGKPGSLKETLLENQFITNGREYLILGSDGELYLQTSPPFIEQWRVLWKSTFPKINNVPGPYELRIQSNGQICCNSIPSTPYWCFNTQDLGGRYLTLINQGATNMGWGIQLLSEGGKIVYALNQDQHYAKVDKHQLSDRQKLVEGNYLYNIDKPDSYRYFNTKLLVNQFITTGQYYLKLLQDGNLVLYNHIPNGQHSPINQVWRTQFTSIQGPMYAAIDHQGLFVGSTTTGSLVKYRTSMKPFDSNTTYLHLPLQASNQVSGYPLSWSMIFSDPLKGCTGGIISTLPSNGVYYAMLRTLQDEYNKPLYNAMIQASFDTNSGIWMVYDPLTMIRYWEVSYKYNPSHGDITKHTASFATGENLCLRAFSKTLNSNINYLCMTSPALPPTEIYSNIVVLPGLLDLLGTKDDGTILFTMSNYLSYNPTIQSLP
eukprot:gene6217-7742_t